MTAQSPDGDDDDTSVADPSGGQSCAQPVPDARRWIVLASFCLHSFVQCFVFMDFSTNEALTERALHISGRAATAESGLLYYGGFAATLPAMCISLWLLLHGRDRTAGLAMSVLIVCGAWLRLLAATWHSYAAALTSTVLLGMAGGCIFTSFTSIPERWFPEHEKGFATALAVQSNYAGWAVGVLNPSMFGSMRNPTEAGLDHFLVVQGIAASALLPIHLLANSRGPAPQKARHLPAAWNGGDGDDGSTDGGGGADVWAHGDGSAGSRGGGGGGVATRTGNVRNVASTIAPTSTVTNAPGEMDFVATMSMLSRRPQYIIHTACYSSLGAVGYAVTGIMNECFSAALPAAALADARGDTIGSTHPSDSTLGAAKEALSAEETMWLNFVFVLSGVLVGLLAGKWTRPRRYALVVRSLFVIGACALLCVQLLLFAAQWTSMSRDLLYRSLLCLMIFAGAGSLGFTSIGLRVAVAESAPAAELYSGSVIEFFLLAISCTLGLLTYVLPPKFTFVFFAVPACVACIAIFACARFPRPADRLLVDGLIAHQDVRSTAAGVICVT